MKKLLQFTHDYNNTLNKLIAYCIFKRTVLQNNLFKLGLITLTYILFYISFEMYNIIISTSYIYLKVIPFVIIIPLLILSIAFLFLVFQKLYSKGKHQKLSPYFYLEEFRSTKSISSEINNNKDFNNLLENKFIKLIDSKSSSEVLTIILDNEIINYKGEWISEKLNRNRDICLFIAKLIENNLISNLNQREIKDKGKHFFKKNIDSGELNKVIKLCLDDNLPIKDIENYKYLCFLDTIKI